jgi:hypothetical protein
MAGRWVIASADATASGHIQHAKMDYSGVGYRQEAA